MVSTAVVLGAALAGSLSASYTPDNLEVQTTAATPRWEEDSLPPILYVWGNCQTGKPCDLRGPRFADPLANAEWPRDKRHVGCWASVNDTTLVTCPDGFRMYS